MNDATGPIVSRTEQAYARLTFASGVLFFGFLIAYLASAQSLPLDRPAIDFSGFALGRDFLNNWMAGRSAFSGGPVAWFDVAHYAAALREVTGRADLHGYQWSYPPHLVLFVWPLGLLPYLPAYALWCGAGLAVYLWAARCGGAARSHSLFLAVAPGAAVNVLCGQNGFFTAALVIGGLANLDRRPALSGILFGILTVKPQFGLLLPLLLVVTGRWRIIAYAVGTTAVLVVAIAIWFGPDVWLEFFRQVMPRQQQAITDAGRLGWAAVSSAFVDARRIGLPTDAAWVVQAIVSCGAAAMVMWTFVRRREPALSLALLVSATFLVSPYMLNYDMVVLGFIAARLRERTDNTAADHVLILAIWTLPVAMLVFGAADVPVATPVLGALAGRLMWRLAHVAPAPVAAGGVSMASARRVPA